MYQNFVKRIFDFILSTISLLILSPFLFIISVLIKIDSNGPVFYMQDRLGVNENLFKLFKFRTMTHKQRNTHRQVFHGDPEVTRVGAILRRLKIDELPQLINVFLGDMSIVGPRPCLPSIKEKFGKYAVHRFKVKPGLSSLSAIKGSIYLSWEQKGYWDMYYIENLSLKMDLLIILRTFKVILIGEQKLFANLKNQ